VCIKATLPNRFSKSPGMTLVEILMVVVVLALLAPPLTRAVQQMLRFSTKGVFEWRASTETRPMDVLLEQDLNEMVSLKVATPRLIEFIMDSNRMPGFDPNGDTDGDKIPNNLDADDDNDTNSWPVPSQWQKTGNDLDDDDDDGNGKEDLRVRYRFDGDRLFREENVNERGWTVVQIGRGMRDFQFVYFGSSNRTAGPNLDTNADGQVTEQEIDGGLLGNNNTVLDSTAELAQVYVIQVVATMDLNKDDKAEYRFEKSIFPPLLAFRRNGP